MWIFVFKNTGQRNLNRVKTTSLCVPYPVPFATVPFTTVPFTTTVLINMT